MSGRKPSKFAFPVETTRRAMKEIGGATVVSDEGAEEMCRRIEDFVEEVVPTALKYAKLDGRKTIRGQDIIYAIEGV